VLLALALALLAAAARTRLARLPLNLAALEAEVAIGEVIGVGVPVGEQLQCVTR